jgi:neutral amino acid transport system permease protein
LHLVRRTVSAALALFVVVGLLGHAAPASAEISTPEGIKGFVKNERKDGDNVVRDPVAGAKVTVTTPDGAAVGEATTDADGNYEIPLPAPGTYVLELDTKSLPKGVTATVDNPTKRTVDIRPSQILNGNFFVGKDLRTTKSRISRLPQAIFDGLFFGLIVAICAVGLSLIYGTTGLSNFAHGEMVTFGAVMAYVANRTWGLNLFIAAAFGIICGTAAGWAFDRGVWQVLRKRRVGLTSQMVASIGLGIFFRYLIQYSYGNKTQAYSQFQNQTKPVKLGIIEFPPRVLASLLVCIGVLVAVAAFLMRTRFGKAVRAVSDNPDLASSTGINTNRVIGIVWAIGGGLAALGGVLLALDEKLRWDSGNGLLLLMFAAITLGGLGSAFGALVGSLVIGLAIELSAWLFPDYIDLKRTAALAVLVVVLLIRPQGILGRKERIG